MEENITRDAVVRKDEAVAFGHVEPFDSASDFDKLGGVVAAVWTQGVVKASVLPHERGFFPHKNAPFFNWNRN
jgi:hypothetical protein